MSVLTHPGFISTHVMRRGTRSIAALRMTMFTAALELRYAIDPPDLLSVSEPMPLVIVTTSLRSLRAMLSVNASRTRRGPIVFTSRTRAQDA